MTKLNKQSLTSRRQSNIELLRILAMLMIIAHHVAVHSQFTFASDLITINRLWVQFIRLGGKIGVNIFVLISGYFGVTAPGIKQNKVVKLWLQIFTYSALCLLFAIVIMGENPGIKDFVKNLMPITYYRWWFASAYFVLYLLSPFLNHFLNSLSKATYHRFLLLLTCIWCIIPTLLSEGWQSNPLLWFVFLYSLSGYLNLHTDTSKYKCSLCLLSAGAVVLLTYTTTIIFDVLGTKIPFLASKATYFYDMQMLPVLLIALLLFVGFLNLKIGYVQFINVISSATFGVYLIHDNNYIRGFLWNAVFRNHTYSDSNLLIPYTIMQIIIVYVGASLIELFRIYIIEKTYSPWIDRFLNLIKRGFVRLKASKVFNRTNKSN